ncbi:MAG: 50S ribosomal protein L20 [Spartobacteria bacterium]|nr:50S ribosomal protein L20 [Spartobacteria bacterium]
MPRATNAPASRKRRKTTLKKARGFYGSRSKLYRMATESVDRAMSMQFEHRKQKKRNYRAMWIMRINAACRLNGVRYGRFIEACTKAKVALNRKMLSEIAIYDPEGFASIIAMVKPSVK